MDEATAKRKRANVKRWRRENPEKARALKRKWAAGWRARNPKEAQRRAADWRARNPEKHRRAVKAAKTPESIARYAQVRRARKKGANAEPVDALVVLELDDGVCGICGDDVDPFNFEVDHVIPLARGGDHNYANTQAAHKLCNARKGAS